MSINTRSVATLFSDHVCKKSEWPMGVPRTRLWVAAPDAISKLCYVAGRGFSCKVERPRLAQIDGDAAMRSYCPSDRVQRPPRSHVVLSQRA